MPTPNRGYTYPDADDAATVPADLQTPLEQIDADVQTLVDTVDPAALREGAYELLLSPIGALMARKDGAVKVQFDVNTGKMIAGIVPWARIEGGPDLSGYATIQYVDAAVADVDALPAGDIPIFATLAEAQAWETENPGRVALTTEAPPDPGAWVAAAPSFDVMAGTVTIPTDAGATYTVNGTVKAAGSHGVTVPSTVTVAAVAKPGYTLAGQTEWVQEFEENITAYEGVALGYAPQLYYRMDDTSGVPVNRGVGGASARMTGTPTYGAPGVGGFPRSITTAGGSSLFLEGLPPAGTTAYTYASIIRLEDTSGGNIFSDFAGKNQARLNPGLVWTGWGPTASLGGWASGLLAGDTHHVALTWDGALVRLYVDGVVVKEVADTGPHNGAPALKVSEGAFSTNGVIIDHTYALTASEVQALSDAVVR